MKLMPLPFVVCLLVCLFLLEIKKDENKNKWGMKEDKVTEWIK